MTLLEEGEGPPGALVRDRPVRGLGLPAWGSTSKSTTSKASGEAKSFTPLIAEPPISIPQTYLAPIMRASHQGSLSNGLGANDKNAADRRLSSGWTPSVHHSPFAKGSVEYT